MPILRFLRDTLLNFLLPKRNVYSACENIKMEDLLSVLHPHISKTPITTTALFHYKNENVKSLIKGLKYHGYKRSAEIFGLYIGDYLLEEFADEEMFGSFKEPVFIPVPITQSKKIKRGYNQSELIAKQVVKRLREATSVDIAYDVLKRIGSTISQTKTQDKEERLDNVANQFIVMQRMKIKGRNVLLIDDVVTTGATLKAASDALLRAGAKEVRAIVVAH